MCLHPPEFLRRDRSTFELLSAAGLFESGQPAIRTITAPEFANAFLALGANKGLIGAGFILGASLLSSRRSRWLAPFSLEAQASR
jgi:hypothetical protein